MDKIRNIVLAYNGFERDEPIPRQVVALARQHSATVHMVNVVDEIHGRSWTTGSISAKLLLDALIEQRKRKSEALAGRARKSGA